MKGLRDFSITLYLRKLQVPTLSGARVAPTLEVYTVDMPVLLMAAN
jgi:hypothetical protein